MFIYLAVKTESMGTCNKKLDDLLFKNEINCIPALLDNLNYIMNTEEFGLIHTDAFVADEELLKDVEKFDRTKASLYFGRTLRDLNFVISDENGRKLNMWIQYVAPKVFRLRDIDMPHSYIKDKLFKTLQEAVDVFIQHANKLSNYFYQLDKIKELCTISEPVKATYKENFRKIQLAERIWLHVEVSKEGSAKNFQLIGQYEQHRHKLQELLLAWDHDQDIAAYIMTVISSLNGDNILKELVEDKKTQLNSCSICLCFELSINSNKSGASIPQPLCSNTSCGVYYHRSCLYKWLVVCEGGRPPQFGVAIGACPSCLHPIQCNEKDI